MMPALLFIVFSAALTLFATIFFMFFFGTEQAFEMAVIISLIYFILCFVQFLRDYDPEYYRE